MANLGTAYIKIAPDLSGVQGKVARGMQGAGASASNEFSKGFQRNSGGFTAAVGRMAKRGAKIIGAGIALVGAAVTAMTIRGGIARALNIDDAQAKLRGLGHDAKSVENIMTSALDSVRGTAFGLDAAATTAAGAVAAGIKPGKELTKYLTLTADAATIAGIGMDEMGSIMNKVTTSGRAMTDNLNQLSDRGIPIFQWLQEEYKVSAEELRKMVSNGEVDAATFRKVIEKNIGGAALESGATVRGAWANMKAAMSRVGAAIVTQEIPRIQGAIGGFTKWVDENADVFTNFASNIINGAIRIGGRAIELGRTVASYLAPSFMELYSTVRNELIPALGEFTTQILAPLARVLGTVLVFALREAINALTWLVSTLSTVLINISRLQPIIYGMVASWGAYRLAVIGVNAVTMIQSGLAAAMGTRYLLLNGALITAKSSTIGMTVAQTALNTVMRLNPIGLAIGAVVGITTAYINARTQTDNVKNATDRLNDAKREYKRVTDLARESEDRLSDSKLRAEGSALAVERAQRSYNDAVKQYGPDSLEAREAAYNLKRAEDELANANRNVRDATKEAENAEREKAGARKAVESAEGAKARAVQGVTNSARNQRDEFDLLTGQLSNLNGKNFSYSVSGTYTSYEEKKAATGTGVPFKAPAGRHAGGPVRAGVPYLVGENSDGSINKTTELFMPNVNGRIVSSSELSKVLSTNGTSATANNQREYHIGNINIGSEVDGEKWLRKLTGNQEITSARLTPTQRYM